MSLRKISIAATLLLTFLVAPGFMHFYTPSPAEAQFGLFPFGGLATTIVPCPCNGARMVTYGPPVPTVLLVFEGTPIYQYGMTASAIHPGQWGLGLELPGGECMSAAKCAPIVTKGTLIINPTAGVGMIGTSI